MAAPSFWKSGKKMPSGLPAAISVRTGTMSVSPLLTVAMSTEPPSSSNAVVKAPVKPEVYGSPSWMAAMLRRRSSLYAN